MSGTLIIGGAYFTDPKLGFLDKYEGTTFEVPWGDVLHGTVDNHRIPKDWYFVFGLKKWVRRLKKARIGYNKIPRIITNYLKAVMPPKAPMGVLDDCNLADEEKVGDRLRKILFTEFNCKVYLLRECLRRHTYSSKVVPFSIPCNDFTHLEKPVPRRWLLYFHGDYSHKERKKVIRDLRDYHMANVHLKLYTGGNRSHDKMPREEFLEEMSNSFGSIVFPGAGYCTFRYQEVPSCGGLIVTKKYPWKVRNDYIHGNTCFHYRSVDDMEQLVSDHERWEEVRQAGVEHFKKYHTVDVRYREFLEYLDDVRGDSEL